METRDEDGLTVRWLTLDEALDGAGHTEGVQNGGGNADVLRVAEPPRDAWSALRARGFVPKPAKISWITETRDSDEEFLARLPKGERWSVRRARRIAAEDGVRFVVQEPVEATALDAFLHIYHHHIGTMRHGVPYAGGQREAILGGPFFAVWACAGAELLGGCLVVAAPGAPYTKIRYAAVAGRFRDTGLSRAVYLEAVRASRERGFTATSLGTEPNVYGHIAKAGLFSFKRRMGFAPMPSQDLGNAGGVEADRVLHLGGLEDPGMILGYPDSPGWLGGWGHFYTSAPDLDLGPYRTDLMAGVRVIRLSAGRPVSGRRG
ncbi:hypothetical protein HUT19_35750 [Streptomyces sp. NA02950]|uniref:hypothetical protein n=1 Tax=Streptomyces sp. NA02950 TaxID=2742137 RepID=UPI001591376B|nr:hypothetical protein [Streptomyces sp. NA02950]QKV96405.1 hypothetical protein HUT19_35750 [Streptomyces sp. NA02950]